MARPGGRAKQWGPLLVAGLVLWMGAWLWSQQESSLLVIQGATLIDGNGGPPIPNSVIVIERGRILQVGRRSQPFPSDATVIRADGKTVMPALFDIDTHIGQQGLEAAAQALSNYLYHGVTSISDTGVTFLHGEGLRRLEREGQLISPRIFEAGPTMTAVGGHPIPVNRSLGRTIDTRTLTQVGGPEEAVRQVRRYVDELKVVTIKTILESGGELGWPRMTPETYGALVKEAHRSGMKVYTHASQLADVRDALEGGVDLLAHGFSEELTPDSDIARLIIERGASWLPDLNNAESAAKIFDHPGLWQDADVLKTVPRAYREMVKDPAVRSRLRSRLERSRRSFEIRKRTVGVLYRMGANILVGTDSTGAPHRMFYGWDIHREMEHLVAAGMKPMDVLVAATYKAAQYLGQESELGTVEAGKVADLLILAGDPLQDIRNTRKIQRVIYAGRLIERDSLPMLDPFQDGLVATGKARQVVKDQPVEAHLVDRFPAGAARSLVVEKCSGCHSLQVTLEAAKNREGWQAAVEGMLGSDDPDIGVMVDYLLEHFGH